jgi:hypothetical protein
MLQVFNQLRFLLSQQHTALISPSFCQNGHYEPAYVQIDLTVERVGLEFQVRILKNYL